MGEDAREDAHWHYAIPMEERAIGGYREGTSPKKYLDDDDDDDACVDYTQKIKYSYANGRVVIVNYTVIGGSITKVSRHLYGSEKAWQDSDEYVEQMDDGDAAESMVKDLERKHTSLEEELESASASAVTPAAAQVLGGAERPSVRRIV